MNSKTIYVVRHGETEFNRKGIVQGSQVDAPLNGKGRAQAKAFFNAYSNFNPDAVFCSTLKRTKESVQSFVDKASRCESFAALNEISWGSDDGKILNDNSLYLSVVKRWAEGEVSLKAGNGESPKEVFQRQTQFIKEILEKGEEERILICMHGRAMRILFCQLLKRPLDEMDSFVHNNLCLYEFRFENGEYHLVKANDVTHLEGVV